MLFNSQLHNEQGEARSCLSLCALFRILGGTHTKLLLTALTDWSLSCFRSALPLLQTVPK